MIQSIDIFNSRSQSGNFGMQNHEFLAFLKAKVQIKGKDLSDNDKNIVLNQIKDCKSLKSELIRVVCHLFAKNDIDYQIFPQFWDKIQDQFQKEQGLIEDNLKHDLLLIFEKVRLESEQLANLSTEFYKSQIKNFSIQELIFLRNQYQSKRPEQLGMINIFEKRASILMFYFSFKEPVRMDYLKKVRYPNTSLASKFVPQFRRIAKIAKV
ncbi:UNKNOWN [Stylonychia lemnae]|uniref:Uncharacterized protein n=1 Tax=Stylonychia lemnae TaxID=5949 RepID=A0A078A2N7_STYLE|nr:UNKNOWN [Stylonychia lemnae]|eukprot:CDW75044.1 UNKNOWN [Stylonychia lemnae]